MSLIIITTLAQDLTQVNKENNISQNSKITLVNIGDSTSFLKNKYSEIEKDRKFKIEKIHFNNIDLRINSEANILSIIKFKVHGKTVLFFQNSQSKSRSGGIKRFAIQICRFGFSRIVHK